MEVITTNGVDALDAQLHKTNKNGEMKKEVTIDTEASTSSSPPSSKASDSYSMDLAARRKQFMSQPSTVATRRQQAICVRRAHKSYGTKNNPNVILDGLNMTVPKGSM